jgi:hypothetical protein
MHRMPTPKKNLAGLKRLGRRAKPSKRLEVFPNHSPGRRYTVTPRIKEFTFPKPGSKSKKSSKSPSVMSV